MQASDIETRKKKKREGGGVGGRADCFSSVYLILSYDELITLITHEEAAYTYN
jgi:hypothetical protein